MKLHLDALTEQDCEEIRIWRNREPAGLRTVMPLTPKQQAEFYEKTVSNRKSDHRYWAVRDAHQAETDGLVGCVGLTNIDWINGHAEISLIVGASLNGIGRAAVSLVLAEAFDRMRLDSVVGEVYLCSPALGFWQKVIPACAGDGVILPRRKWHDGKLWDSWWFTIPREVYQQRRPAA